MADDKVIRIKLDGSGARLEAGRTNAAVKGVGSSADSATRSMFNLKSAAVAVIAALATSRITQYADSWTIVNNQIKQATSTTREALAVQEAIFQIAKDSRVEINGVADAYQRISNSVKDYGFSTSDSLQVVEGLTKAFKANGASAQEVSSVLIQLGQGLGAGALQGEELKAILEASLPVSRAIANEFGVQVGQLKALGAEGKLTTERVFTAIQNSLPAFETAFEKANKTIAEGFTVTNSSVTRLIGLTSEATGAGDTLANGLIDLASAVDQLGDAVESGAAGKIAEVFKAQLNLIVSDVTTTVNYIFDSWDDTSKAVQASFTKTGEFVGDAFLNIIPNIRTMIQVLTVELASGIDKLAAYGKAVEQTLNPFDDVSANQARGFFGRQVKQIDEVREASIQSIFDQREVEKAAQNERIAEAEALIAKYKEQRAARSADLSSGALGGAPTPEQRTNNDLDSFFSQDGIFSGGTDNQDDSAFQATINREKLVTQQLQEEISARRAFLNGEINQRQLDEELALQEVYYGYEVRRAAILENEKITAEQRNELLATLAEQELLAEQAKLDAINSATESSLNDRQAMQEAYTQSVQALQMQTYSNATALLNSLNSESKAAALIGIGIQTATAFAANSAATASAATLAYASQLIPGDPTSIARASAAAAKATALGNVNGALILASGAAKGFGALGGGGGGSPSTGGSSGALSESPTPRAQTASEQQQSRRVIDLRGFDNGGYLTKEQLTELLSGDDDVIIASNSGQQQGARVGLING